MKRLVKSLFPLLSILLLFAFCSFFEPNLSTKTYAVSFCSSALLCWYFGSKWNKHSNAVQNARFKFLFISVQHYGLVFGACGLTFVFLLSPTLGGLVSVGILIGMIFVSKTDQTSIGE